MITSILKARIRDYLGNGGLFNPDLMDHAAVRDLIIDCRSCINELEAELKEERAKTTNEVIKVMLNATFTKSHSEVLAAIREIAGRAA